MGRATRKFPSDPITFHEERSILDDGRILITPVEDRPIPFDSDEDEVADYGGEYHRWVCPACEDVQDEGFDPRGETVKCTACGWQGRCGS
jgi:hypothetical protein